MPPRLLQISARTAGASKIIEVEPDGYTCPQCRVPKKRFAEYDVYFGKAIGGGLLLITAIVGLLAGIAGVGALLVYAFIQ